MKIKPRMMLRGIYICVVVAVLMWLFLPYVQVANLTRKYGDFFEDGYKQSEWFREEQYMNVKVLRYKDESARVVSDSDFVGEMMQDKRRNIAVVCYDSIYIMVFRLEEDEWKLDTYNDGGENWIALQSGTTSNAIWPFYL